MFFYSVCRCKTQLYYSNNVVLLLHNRPRLLPFWACSPFLLMKPTRPFESGLVHVTHVWGKYWLTRSPLSTARRSDRLTRSTRRQFSQQLAACRVYEIDRSFSCQLASSTISCLQVSSVRTPGTGQCK